MCISSGLRLPAIESSDLAAVNLIVAASISFGKLDVIYGGGCAAKQQLKLNQQQVKLSMNKV